MKLNYRGLSYVSSESAIETIKTDVVVQFLGATYPLRHPVTAQRATSRKALKFRGIEYFG